MYIYEYITHCMCSYAAMYKFEILFEPSFGEKEVILPYIKIHKLIYFCSKLRKFVMCLLSTIVNL